MRTPEAVKPQQIQIRLPEQGAQISKVELVQARGGVHMTLETATPRPVFDLGDRLNITSMPADKPGREIFMSVGGCDGNDGSRGDGSCRARCR